LDGLHAIDTIESPRHGGPVVKIAPDDFCAVTDQIPRLRLVRMACQCTYGKSLITQVPENGAALLSSSSSYQD